MSSQIGEVSPGFLDYLQFASCDTMLFLRETKKVEMIRRCILLVVSELRCKNKADLLKHAANRPLQVLTREG